MKSKSEHAIRIIKKKLKQTAPDLDNEQMERRDKILNSDNPDFTGYGHKMGDLEKLAREVQQSSDYNYEDALDVFQSLIKSNIHEEKFIGVLFLNRFKRYFDKKILNSFEDLLRKYCDTWALCDSSMIKVVGPFLAKKGNEELAVKIIKDWSDSEILWVRRASLVIFLKIAMIKKGFDEEFLFTLLDKVKGDPESYIQKAIAWLLRTCSRYTPQIIYTYLLENKNNLSRLILREGSKKLTKIQRSAILAEN